MSTQIHTIFRPKTPLSTRKFGHAGYCTFYVSRPPPPPGTDTRSVANFPETLVFGPCLHSQQEYWQYWRSHTLEQAIFEMPSLVFFVCFKLIGSQHAHCVPGNPYCHYSRGFKIYDLLGRTPPPGCPTVVRQADSETWGRYTRHEGYGY